MIARAKQELGSDVNRSLFVRTHMNRRIPIESQLPLSIIRLWSYAAIGERTPVYPRDISALRLRIRIIGVRGIWENKEAIPPAQILPSAIRYPSGIGRISYPVTVVLHPAIHVVWIRIVHAHVIELGNRQIVALPPIVAPVVGIPNSAVISRDQMIGVVGVHPNIVHVTMHPVRYPAETFSTVLTHDHAQVRLVNLVLVLGIHHQVRKIKWTPDHQIAGVATRPALAPIIRAV